MNIGRVERVTKAGPRVIYESDRQEKPNRQAHDDWPNPEPLGQDLPAVAALDLKILPRTFRPLVEDVSELMQTPPDYAAAPAVVGLAGCVGRRARIFPKVEDSSFIVIPNEWGVVIGGPGLKKTPVAQQIASPLFVIEAEWNQRSADEEKEFQKRQRAWQLSRQVWESEYKKSLKNNDPLPAEPMEPSGPVKRRLISMDSTPEKLHEILFDNPCGILVWRDELVGLLSEMSKQGREDQRAFFLSGWNGSGTHTVDRIGRGSITVRNVCISVFGLIQPARLLPHLEEIAAGGPADDGFLQRFGILVWPDTSKDFRIVDRAPNRHARDAVAKVFSRLAALPPESISMRFDPEAQECFFRWWSGHETKLRSDSGMNPAFISHLSKYSKLMPALCGLFELADCGELSDGQSVEISLGHTEQAAGFCTYLESHARRVYSCLPSLELRSARALAGHIQRGALKSPFKIRDVCRSGWASLTTREEVLPGLEFLEECGWIRRAKSEGSGPGRPSESWLINPKVPRQT